MEGLLNMGGQLVGAHSYLIPWAWAPCQAVVECCGLLDTLTAAPHPRQLSMMLMLAQSNPQLFALIGTRASITKELERVEQQSRLEQLSPAELLSRNQAHWAAWLQEYR